METTIDKAGRVVLPRELRERVGLMPGPVEVVVDGAALRIEAVARGRLIEQDGRLVIAPSGQSTTADAVRELRDDQR